MIRDNESPNSDFDFDLGRHLKVISYNFKDSINNLIIFEKIIFM